MKTEWPNFSEDELRCQHTGKLNPNAEFELLMDDVQECRDALGPLTITSAYRAPEHPIEARKAKPGWHSIAAVDISVSGDSAIKVLKFFLNKGYVGIGVQQKGSGRFIHIDRREQSAIWSY